MDEKQNQNADESVYLDHHSGEFSLHERDSIKSSSFDHELIQDLIYRRIVEESGKLFIALNSSSEIIYANTLFKNYFNLDDASLFGKPISDISLPENIFTIFKEKIEFVFDKNDFIECSFNISGQNHEEFFKGKIIPLTISNSKLESVVLLLEDISLQQMSTIKSSQMRDQLKKMISERTQQLEESNRSLYREIVKSENARREVAKSQKFLSTIFDTIHDKLAVITKDYKIIKYNWKAGSRIDSDETTEDQICYAVLMNRNSPCDNCPLAQVYETGKSCNIELVTNEKSTLNVKVFPVFDENKNVKYTVSHYRDISAEKKMEVNANLLKKAQEIGQIGHWTFLYESGEMYWSDQFYNIFGFDLNTTEPSLENIKKCIHPEDVESSLPVIIALFASSKIDRFEFRFIKENGQECHAYALKDQIYDSDNEAIGVIGVLQDITERVHNERKLRKSKEQWKELFESSPDGIYIRQGHKFLLVNTGFELLFNYEREYFLDDEFDYLNLVYRNDSEKIKLILEEQIEPQHEPQFFCFIGITNDYRKINCEVKESALEWKGEKVIIGFVRDQTSIKKLESDLFQSQKMESIGKLVGSIAHDFNNFLTIISGISDLALIEHGEKLPVYDEIKEIIRTTERAQGLTKGLLGFSRKQEIKPVNVNLNVALNNMQKMLNNVTLESIMLRFIYANDLKNIKADPVQIEQIIVNLVVNASDAIEQNGIITIRTMNFFMDDNFRREHVGAVPGNYVLLSVTDNGKGMDKDILEKIFEPFYTTKCAGKGTGLGMATVYGIIKQNNGYIDVKSTPGYGTTVNVFFPSMEDEEHFGEAETSVFKEKNLKGDETILVIEDELAVRNLAIKALKHFGYNALGAEDVFHAFDIARKTNGKIDIILSDVIMPGMNGPEVAQKISEIHPEASILFMSGYTEKDIVHHGVLRAEINFLPKPFKPVELVQKIRKILDNKVN